VVTDVRRGTDVRPALQCPQALDSPPLRGARGGRMRPDYHGWLDQLLQWEPVPIREAHV